MNSIKETADSEKTMNSPVQAVADTKVDVVPAHAEGEHSRSPVEPSRGGRTIGLLFAIALLIAIGYGLYLRNADEKKLTQSTQDAAILTVSVVHPSAGSKADDLALPGTVQAFIDAPIYSRTNGYLSRWYFDIGARVHKGDLLAVVETPEVDQQLAATRAELDRMQANADLALVTSNRWQALLAKHAVSQQEADQTRSSYIAAEAAVDASKAEVRRLEQLQSYEHIIAPFDGIITARNTDIGDLIDAGSGSSNPRELFHLDASDRLRVYISVPEVYADSIHNGDSATITQDSNPDMKIQGSIVRNSDAISYATRTLNVEVDLDNSKGELKPGAYVFVHFGLPANGNEVTIPSNTLLFRSEGLRAGIVRGGQVHLQPVTIGQDYGNAVQIVSGLNSNDEVILDPPDSLAEGQPVHVKGETARGQQ
jgi:RND family efflux transporter MFP subunit